MDSQVVGPSSQTRATENAKEILKQGRLRKQKTAQLTRQILVEITPEVGLLHLQEALRLIVI